MSGAKLDNIATLQSPGLKALVEALDDDGTKPRIVGGAVRDSLLGLAVSDIDLATPLVPDEVVKRLEHAGIKAVPTGIDHGTITAVSQGKTFEVTTLRRDVSTDGRRATVAFSSDWEEDAARRDFTINALYADPESGEIFDYFGGIEDLKVGIIRFIGDAATRIAEDHLRILRFFRFYARFGQGEPDAEAITACAAAAKSLMALSRERIADELMKLLATQSPSASISLMLKNGIFAAFMPELDAKAETRLARLLAREETVSAPASSGRRLNALLPDNSAVVEKVAARLKLSNRIRQELLLRLIEMAPVSANARALAYRHSVEIATDLFLLHGADRDWEIAVASLQNWEPPLFPIKGGYLVSIGLQAGPLVAKTLQEAERLWIEEGFPDADRATAIADQLVAAKLSVRKE